MNLIAYNPEWQNDQSTQDLVGYGAGDDLDSSAEESEELEKKWCVQGSPREPRWAELPDGKVVVRGELSVRGLEPETNLPGRGSMISEEEVEEVVRDEELVQIKIAAKCIRHMRKHMEEEQTVKVERDPEIERPGTEENGQEAKAEESAYEIERSWGCRLISQCNCSAQDSYFGQTLLRNSSLLAPLDSKVEQLVGETPAEVADPKAVTEIWTIVTQTKYLMVWTGLDAMETQTV